MVRKDTRTTELVQQAIGLYDKGERNKAVKMLQDAKLSDATIARVLCHPEQRRKDLDSIPFEP